jgi:hypothetical protein
MVGSVNRGYQAERDRLGDQAKASRAAFDQGFQEWVPGQLSRHRAWGYISTDPRVDPPARRWTISSPFIQHRSRSVRHQVF